MDSLQEVSVENWVHIQKECLKDWPKGISTYNLLETQKKYKEFGCDSGFKVYCPFGRIDSGIVAISEFTFYEVVIQCPKLDTSTLEEALLTTKVIDWKKSVTVPFAPEHIVELLKRVVPKLNLEIDFDPGAKLYAKHKDEPLFEQVTFTDGVTFGELNHEHIPLVDSVWPHKYNGSQLYFKKMIDVKGSLGLFKNNELISWVFIGKSGKLTHMYTIEKERNKGYGEALLRIVSNKLLQEGRDVIAYCVEGNPAYKLYERNRFHNIYSVNWCFLKRKE